MAEILTHPRSRVLRRKFFLRIKVQYVVVAPELIVKAAANICQKVRSLAQRLQRIVVAFTKLNQPLNHVQIPHASRRLFYIRFQVIDGVVVLGVARGGHLTQMPHQFLPLLQKELRELGVECLIQIPISSQKPLIDQADAELYVLAIELAAFMDRAHRLADPQAAIPKSTQKSGEGIPLLSSLDLPFRQDENIDVGVREQVTPPKPADGKDSEPLRKHRGHCSRISRLHQFIHHRAALSDGGGYVSSGEEILLNPFRTIVRIRHGLRCGSGWLLRHHKQRFYRRRCFRSGRRRPES